jgi:hypothetical protein
MLSRFLTYLEACNRPRLDGLRRWLFEPGMEFQAGDKWWGDRGRRAAPHEGLDFYRYEDAQGAPRTVDGNLQIPAAFAGCVENIAPDFLGQSIFLSHDFFTLRGRRLYSIYGHTAPRAGLQAGRQVEEGEVIARLAAPAGKPRAIPPHLHLTCAWIAPELPPEEITWQTLAAHPAIILLDPLEVIGPP